MRRALPQVRSGVLLALGGTLLLLLAGTTRKDLLAFPSGVVGLSFAMTVGLNGMRDRMDHGLEFVQSLPVLASEAAMARLIACALLTLPGALLTTTALILVLPEALGRAPPPGWLVAVAVGSWAALFLAGALLCAALLRYSQAQLRLVPPSLAIAMVALTSLPAGWLPQDRWLLAVLSAPWFPVVAPIVTWTLGAATAWLAHRMLAVAIRDFRPARDKIEW